MIKRLDGVDITQDVQRKLLELWRNCIDTNKDLVQVDEDIWITDRSIEEHADSTKDDLVSYVFILLNTNCTELHINGGIFNLKAGQYFCIDARLPHSTVKAINGLFSALIWDMPNGYSLHDFDREARLRIGEWIVEKR